MRHVVGRASGMARVRRLLGRCGSLFAVGIVAAACATSPASAAANSSRAGYDSGYEHGYYDGYQRGYDDAYRAATEGAQRDGRSDARGKSRPKRAERARTARYARVAVQIESSVYGDAADSGVPADITAELIRLFSYQVDFSHDVQPRDELEVVFEQQGEGRANGGNILAASITLSGKTQTLYRFRSDGEVEYFDANGRSAMGTLMRTPVDGAQISSRFGRRYSRVHEGIDFRVPPRTPVMAAGSGEVTFAGRSRGYGNLLVIEHGNGYSTAYAHLSRFASGVRKGTPVRQGEVVAYSGATGNATGPHVHYETRVNGVAVNPETVTGAFGRALKGEERKRFLAERDRIDELMASLPVQKKLGYASNSSYGG